MSTAAIPDWAQLSLGEEEYRRAAASYRRRRSLRAFAFVVPYLLPWIAFLLIPAGWAVYLSFQGGGLTDDAKFVGVHNWQRAAEDPELRTSVINTAQMMGIAVSAV